MKTILMLLAIIVGALAVLAVIGFISTILGYILILSIVCLGGYIAFRVFDKSETKQLSAPDPKKELEKVQRLLDQYKK